MALTYPLSLATFASNLRVERITFHLADALEQKTSGAGEILTAQLGVRLWYGTVFLAYHRWEEYEDAMALIRELGEPGSSFLALPYHGQKTGHPAGTLNTVSGRQVRFAGVGAGRVLKRGQFFSFAYGTKRAFHQLSEQVTADSGGLTPLVQVVPPLQPGYSLGAAVEFAAPVVKAVLVPGSVREPEIRSVVAEPFTFDWRQTLL